VPSRNTPTTALAAIARLTRLSRAYDHVIWQARHPALFRTVLQRDTNAVQSDTAMKRRRR